MGPVLVAVIGVAGTLFGALITAAAGLRGQRISVLRVARRDALVALYAQEEWKTTADIGAMSQHRDTQTKLAAGGTPAWLIDRYEVFTLTQVIWQAEHMDEAGEPPTNLSAVEAAVGNYLINVGGACEWGIQLALSRRPLHRTRLLLLRFRLRRLAPPPGTVPAGVWPASDRDVRHDLAVARKTWKTYRLDQPDP